MFWFGESDLVCFENVYIFYRQLFRIDGVKGVLLGPDFITISKVKSHSETIGKTNVEFTCFSFHLV